MSTAVLDCPEDSNSTDCLLRAVLRVLKENQDQGDSKYDWDPVTFVFTVLLGVGALAFAGLTIAQGLVTARKGYRKASKRAISTWAENTQKEWIWGELNFQYTARTPIFRIDYLLDWVKDWDSNGLTIRPGSPYKDVDPGHVLQSANAATWIAFFKVTGLEKVEPPRKAEPSEKDNLPVKAWLLDRFGLQEKAESSENDCGLRSTVADFLPDDLVAAPAYAQGGVVIAAAAAVGIQRWPFTRGIPEQPVIIGRSFQFDFRQHPILGSIGSFSNHHPTDETIKVPSPHKLKSTMQYALGIIKLHGLSQSEDVKIKVNLVSDYESFKDQMVKVAEVTQSIHSTTPFDRFYGSRAYLEEHVNVNHCLFKAVTPDDPPELFPLTSSKLTVDCSLTTLALCGKYWAKADLHAFGKSEFGSWPTPTSEYPLPSWRPFDWGVDHGWGSVKPMLQLCLKQVNNPDEVREWYGKADPETQQDLRRRILKQLRLVDIWLGHEEDVDFRTADLYRTYLVLSHAEKAAKAKIFNAPVNEAGRDGSHANDNSKFAAAARSRHLPIIRGIRDLLDTLKLARETLEAMLVPDGESTIPSEHLDHLKEVFRKYQKELDVITAPFSDMSTESTQMLVDRLCVVVVCNSEQEDGWPLWDRFSSLRDDSTRDVDDVLIFRFILMVLLFQTAIDNSEVLNSSLWDRVIPII
ncbi:hypothetical protein CDEST_07315 [Colletotrichum destructivum]|uniref:Uncharacterized protein n=1 Tax=Colletotrichum destructivum TaxID=34406 RepID=A0AAX4IH97_9PEZI|nr:hypothetical protein CDEST_07315 [Colletotrichum destructivum]